MKAWIFDERRPMVSGPWDDEPDKVQWTDQETDLDCLIVRNHYGAWYGYVGVPPDHPWHRVDYGHVDPSPEIHGGLTYSAFCQEGAEDDPGICHVPEPGRPPDVWWFGFDCGHAFDLIPHMIEVGNKVGVDLISNTTYRNIDYVMNEVTSLARQLAQVT